MRRRTLVAAAVAVLVLVALVSVVALPRAQQWWKLHRTVAPDAPLSEQCGDDVPDGARRTTLEADDETMIGAAEVGDPEARTGVVLRYGASQTLCDWLPWADALAAETGARVLVFDRRGRGSAPGEESLVSEPGDLVAAVELMRADGVEDVVLVGSSMGNSVTLSALPLLDEAPCALVAISPVLASRDGSGTLDGSRAEPLPPHTWVAWETGSAGVADGAGLLVSRARAQGTEVHPLPVDTDDHSRQLVTGHPEVQDLVEAAVTAC